MPCVLFLGKYELVRCGYVSVMILYPDNWHFLAAALIKTRNNHKSVLSSTVGTKPISAKKTCRHAMDFHPQSLLWHKLPEDLSQPEPDFLQQLYLIGTTASLTLGKQFPVLEMHLFSQRKLSSLDSPQTCTLKIYIAFTKLKQEYISCYFVSPTSNGAWIVLKEPK